MHSTIQREIKRSILFLPSGKKSLREGRYHSSRATIISAILVAFARAYWTVTKLDNMRDMLKTSETSRVATTMVVVLVVFFLLNYALRSVDEATIQIIPH